jgi:hypothetical protein
LASVQDSESWEKLLQQYKLANGIKEAESIKQANARLVDPAQIYTDFVIKVTHGRNIAWKPKNAYSANGKTYVVMPEKMQLTEAPIFFIKANGREKLTNYRVEGNIYVIDRLFDLGIMTIGKDRVAIYRKTPLGAPEKETVPAELKKQPQQPTAPVEKAPQVPGTVSLPKASATADETGVSVSLKYDEEFDIPVSDQNVGNKEQSQGGNHSSRTPLAANVSDDNPPASDKERWDALLEKYDLKDNAGKGGK